MLFYSARRRNKITQITIAATINSKAVRPKNISTLSQAISALKLSKKATSKTEPSQIPPELRRNFFKRSLPPVTAGLSIVLDLFFLVFLAIVPRFLPYS